MSVIRLHHNNAFPKERQRLIYKFMALLLKIPYIAYLYAYSLGTIAIFFLTEDMLKIALTCIGNALVLAATVFKFLRDNRNARRLKAAEEKVDELTLENAALKTRVAEAQARADSFEEERAGFRGEMRDIASFNNKRIAELEKTVVKLIRQQEEK